MQANRLQVLFHTLIVLDLSWDRNGHCVAAVKAKEEVLDTEEWTVWSVLGDFINQWNLTKINSLKAKHITSLSTWYRYSVHVWILSTPKSKWCPLLPYRRQWRCLYCTPGTSLSYYWAPRKCVKSIVLVHQFDVCNKFIFISGFTCLSATHPLYMRQLSTGDSTSSSHVYSPMAKWNRNSQTLEDYNKQLQSESAA